MSLSESEDELLSLPESAVDGLKPGGRAGPIGASSSSGGGQRVQVQ